MHSFKASHNPETYCNSSYFVRGDQDCSSQPAPFADLGELDQPSYGHEDAPVGSIFSLKSGNVAVLANDFHYGALNTSIGSTTEMVSGCLDTGQVIFTASLGNGPIENWGDSGNPDNNSQQTDTTSTDVDNDEKTQYGAVGAVDCGGQFKLKPGDHKTLRRLAQNREAARKSRLRKKAYVHQLENSKVKLMQLEQELQRAKQQGALGATGFSADHGSSTGANGALAFDLDYAHWLEDHQRLINDLRSGVNSHMTDNELRILVDSVMAHYDEIFKLKSIGTKADVFHVLSGMWKTPAERCFMWLGGFRSSELLRVLGNHLEPLTDQQLMGLCNLQQSSQQAEDALSQGMEALQQSLVDTLSTASLGPSSGNVANYMGQMAIAMGRLTTIENFLHQADLLRQQTLYQMCRILTTRQAARALLVISDYKSKLRALSSLWSARPRD